MTATEHITETDAHGRPRITFPQYAMSTDPAVLDAIERNVGAWQVFHHRAMTFALAHSSENDGGYYPSGFGGTHDIRAIASTQKPRTGQWKRGPRGTGWVPYKNNPLHDEMEAITFRRETVPGLPSIIEGPHRADWSQVISTPQPFLVDDVAYVGFSFTPIEQTIEHDHIDGGWQEIRASQYHAAREAFNDAHAAD